MQIKNICFLLCSNFISLGVIGKNSFCCSQLTKKLGVSFHSFFVANKNEHYKPNYPRCFSKQCKFKKMLVKNLYF